MAETTEKIIPGLTAEQSKLPHYVVLELKPNEEVEILSVNRPLTKQEREMTEGHYHYSNTEPDESLEVGKTFWLNPENSTLYQYSSKNSDGEALWDEPNMPKLIIDSTTREVCARIIDKSKKAKPAIEIEELTREETTKRLHSL